MTDDYRFFGFSIFENVSLTALREAVRDVFLSDFENGSAFFEDMAFSLTDFVDPYIGGLHDDIFCFWREPQFPNKIFFTSNAADGRETLCNVLHLRLQCSYYRFALSNDREMPYFLFHPQIRNYAPNMIQKRK